jgi:tetratricopeptide (TPR) repeat protein
MPQKITRRDMKRNDLAETVGKTVDYVSHHRRGVTEGIAIAAGVVLLVGGIFAWRAYVAAVAGRELSAGLEILATPIAGQPAAAGVGKTYPTAQERERQAEPHLKRAASHPATAAGRAATVILAARDSNSAGGAESLQRVAREARAEIAAAAEIDAARLLASQGKTTEAVDRLKRAIESSDVRAPKDALLFALGEIYEKAGQTADARATFQRLVNDYPNSPYRTDARAKLPNANPGGPLTFPNPS